MRDPDAAFVLDGWAPTRAEHRGVVKEKRRAIARDPGRGVSKRKSESYRSRIPIRYITNEERLRNSSLLPWVKTHG